MKKKFFSLRICFLLKRRPLQQDILYFYVVIGLLRDIRFSNGILVTLTELSQKLELPSVDTDRDLHIGIAFVLYSALFYQFAKQPSSDDTFFVGAKFIYPRHSNTS